MTEEEKNVIKQKTMQRMIRIREELLRMYPFFGQLVMRLNFGVADCETAYTDMERVRVDPVFAEQLSDEELRFVILHEVMHCVLKHPIRGEGKLHELYNIACDIVVNSNILDYLGLSTFQVAGEEPMHITPSGREGRDCNAEEVYQELLSRAPVNQQPPSSGGKGMGEGQDGRGSGNPQKGTGGGSPQNGKKGNQSNGGYGSIDTHEIWQDIDPQGLEETWNSIMDQARDAVLRQRESGVKGWSSEDYPPAVLDYYEEAERLARLRWKSILQDYLTSEIRYTDYSFSPPDRRFNDSGYFLPGDNDQYQEELNRVWLCVDTSGSIGYDELSRFMGEILHLIREISLKDGLLSFFDIRITEPVPCSDEENLKEIRAVGGGGTDFGCIFRYLRKELFERLPAVIVILTDGYAPDVDEEAALGVPVIWILIDNERDKPWGKSIHISLKDGAE